MDPDPRHPGNGSGKTIRIRIRNTGHNKYTKNVEFKKKICRDGRIYKPRAVMEAKDTTWRAEIDARVIEVQTI
jgi:hypothetical protein